MASTGILSLLSPLPNKIEESTYRGNFVLLRNFRYFEGNVLRTITDLQQKVPHSCDERLVGSGATGRKL